MALGIVVLLVFYILFIVSKSLKVTFHQINKKHLWFQFLI